MPDYLPIARFPLPTNLEPDGTRCVMVTIPDDDQYQSVLIGLIDLLTWSRNFARDGTKTGAATVSRTWQNALRITPIIQGCAMITDLEFRPVEGNPCQMEYSTDGGETWEIAFDISECINPIAPVSPETDDCNAASNVIQLFTEMMELINDGLDDAQYYPDIASSVGLWLQGLFGSLVFPSQKIRQIAQFLDETYSVEGRQQYSTQDCYADFFEQLLVEIQPDGELDADWLTDFTDWLVEAENAVYVLLADCIEYARLSGRWNTIATFGFNECLTFPFHTWEYNFDFRDGVPHGWSSPAPASNIISDAQNGWVYSEYEVSGSVWSAVAIRLPTETFHIKQYTLNYTMTWDIGSPSEQFRLEDNDAEIVSLNVMDDGTNLFRTNNTSTLFEQYPNGIRATLIIYSNTPSGAEPYGVIHQLTIRGRGFNPFL